ncbi:MAG: oxidoreductase [Alphaproteobacteria bacterium]|nr:oxidoreductase [Alphaproteobacteria bacterium]
MVALPPPATPTLSAIYAAYEADAGDGFRVHLGASLIGKECRRALWYDFRWTTRTSFSGRMLRLFETGQLEESRLIHNLRRTGATVLDIDPDTGRQWQVSAHDGHFGGSMDAVAIGLLEAPKTWHVLEFKTHSTKSFADLKRHGVRQSKPRHWAQMQVYLHLSGMTRAMYLAVNKDTDDIHVERLSPDRTDGEALLAKAGVIVKAVRPPEQQSTDPDWFQCRMCEHHPLCHQDAAPERNCRTCLHSTPVENGWHCAHHDRMLSPGDQRRGCDRHLFIPDLICGEVVDVGDDHVVYRLADGAVWVNGRVASC